MSYRLEIGLAVLIAGALGVALWAANRSPSRTPDFDPRTSTLLRGPEGSKALHEVLVRLGHPSERRRTSLFRLSEEGARRPAVLAVLDPPVRLQDAELDEVVEFVRTGGAVVSAGWGGGITRCAGWRRLPDRFRDDSVSVRARGDTSLHLPRAARVLGPWEQDTERGLSELVKTWDEDTGCSTLILAATDTIVAATDGRPVILQLRYRGGGSIALAADPGWFTNRLWRDTDVAVVILPLLTVRSGPGRPGRVAWDEYHQGFGQRGAQSIAGRTWDWLRAAPAGWAILQLIGVGLVWLAMSAVRFGPARSVIERRRRSPLEHLEALGAGLESAPDASPTVQRIIAGLRRRLSRTAGHVATGDLRAWLESLELALRTQRGRTAVRRLRHLITERSGGEERVLAAAQAVEDVWEELRPRSTHEAF